MPRLTQAAARHRLLAAGIVGYLLGCLVALAAWRHAQAAHEATAIEAFGRATAEDVARLSVAPLMRQDRVRLGVLAGGVAERRQVRRITVRTVDRAPFVVVGDAAQPGSPAFTAPITVQDSVVGNVTVTVDQAAFGPSLAGLLRRSWWWFAAGLLLAAVGGRLADRRGSIAATPAKQGPMPPAETDTPAKAAEQPAQEDGGPFLLVANLFAGAGHAAADREQTLHRGLAVAEAVARETGSEAAPLADVGITVRFPGHGQPDAAYAAVRGALLLRAAMSQAGLPPFRHALEQVAQASPNAAEAVRVMASVAADGQLLLGAAAAGALERPERLRLAAVDTPATAVLPPRARPSQLIHGLAEDQEAELAAQAAAIAASAA